MKELVGLVQGGHEKPGTRRLGKSEFLYAFWDSVKASRSLPKFSFETRAIGLGFANYTRLYRACLLHYGLTPTQLEDEILREIAEFFYLAGDLWNRDCATHYYNREKESYACYRPPYSDGWAKGVEERPEWMREQEALFGLTEDAAQWK